jgi:hypothetical protein
MKERRYYIVNYEFIVNDENFSLKSTIICTSVLLTKYYSGEQIKKNEIGGACSTYGGQERYILGFGAETLGKETISNKHV